MARPVTSRRSLLLGLAAGLWAASPAHASTYMFFDQYDDPVPGEKFFVIPSALNLSGTDTGAWPLTQRPELINGISSRYVLTPSAPLPTPLVMNPANGEISDPTGGAAGLQVGTFAFSYVATGDKGDVGTSRVVTITISSTSSDGEPPPPPPLPVGSCGLVFC